MSFFINPKIEKDFGLNNLTINCNPKLVSANIVRSSTNSANIDINAIKSGGLSQQENSKETGKLEAENIICDFNVNNLTVAGKLLLSSKLNGKNVTGGTEYSGYLFYDDSSKCFQVGDGNVHIGKDSGTGIQGTNSVAIGENAGSQNQGARSVAIGRGAGGSGGLPNIGQGDGCVAIGRGAGSQNQGDQSIAIGANSGLINQGENSIHIGNQAGASFTGGNNSTVISSAGGVGVGNYGANSTCLNSSDVIVNASDDSQLVITTESPNVSKGLKEITDTTAATNPFLVPNFLLPGSDGRFTHYLVYDPDTGEIATCKICLNQTDCSISAATGGAYNSNTYFLAPEGTAPAFPGANNTYEDIVFMTANLQAWGTDISYPNTYPPINDIAYKKLQPSNHRAYLPIFYASGGGAGAPIWKPSTGNQIGISNGMWHSHLTCLNKPSQGGAFVFDSYWAMRDLQTTVDTIASPGGQVVAPTTSNPSTITLQPNFNTWNPNDPFWVDPVTGEGNKILELNTMLSLTATVPIAINGVRQQTEITVPYKYVIQTYDQWFTPSDPGATGPGTNATYWSTNRPGIEIWNKDIYFSGRVVLNTLSPDYTVTAYIRKIRPNVTPSTRSYEIITSDEVDLTNRPSNTNSCGSFVVKLPASDFPPITNTGATGTNWPAETGSAGNWNRNPLQSGSGFFPESALNTVVNPVPAVPNPTIGNTNYLVWVGFEVKGLNANPADEEKLGKIVITSCTYP